MAYSLGGSATNYSAASPITATLTTTGIGNLVLLTVSYQSGPVSSIAGGNVASWTRIIASSGPYATELWYGITNAIGSSTITVSGTAGSLTNPSWNGFFAQEFLSSGPSNDLLFFGGAWGAFGACSPSGPIFKGYSAGSTVLNTVFYSTAPGAMKITASWSISNWLCSLDACYFTYAGGVWTLGNSYAQQYPSVTAGGPMSGTMPSVFFSRISMIV